jgi:flagellar biosynthesis/type III secretory pathway M-ring protein FliF/YscJ
MDFLKSQLDRIQQQLAGLTASQKMLAACLVAIIVMTVAWWGRQAGNSEMAPLFQEALEPAEAGGIKQLLLSRGIDAEIGGDNLISVPAGKLNEAFALLALSERMPKNPSINFESFMKGINPFNSPGMNDAHLVHFKQARLAEVICKFEGVKSADVFIDPTQKTGFNGTGVDPSATVHIRAKNPKVITQAIVDGAASLVMGAQAGLSWKKVTVLVNGSPRRVNDPDMRGSDAPEVLALRDEYQEKYAQRVRDVLPPIPGISVSVTFGLTNETVRRRSHTYDKDKSFTLDGEVQEKSRESTGGAGAGPAGEPGTQPNVGMAVNVVAAAAGGESSYTETDSKTKLNAYASDVIEETVKGPGLTQPVGAAVLIPRSYVVNVLTAGKPNAPEPDDAKIDEWCKTWLPLWQEVVRNNVGLTSVKDVTMGLYPDVTPLAGAGAAAAGSAVAGVTSASIAAVAGTHSREIMLGGLAVVSLFMLLMTVRKAGPAVVATPVGVQTTVPMPLLDATESLAGEVGEGKSLLDAMELDEDAVRAQQMVEQVAAMVDDNPDAAASLVKRWMSRT